MKERKTLEKIIEIKSNPINGADMWQNRQKAKSMIPLAESQVKEKLALGWKFLTKEKTTKLIAPEKIESHLMDGWK